MKRKMEKAQQLSAKLTDEELIKCGLGTNSACFALDDVPDGDGKRCLGVAAEAGDKTALGLFKMAGVIFQFRVHIDERDRIIWCPRGILNDSKS